MAVRRETLRLIKALRATISSITDQQTRSLVMAWSRAWTEAAGEFDTAIAVLLAVADEGRWPTRAQIMRSRRALAALDVAGRELQRLASQAGREIARATAEVVRETAAAQPDLIASQLPSNAGDRVTLRASFDRVDPQTLSAIVDRTTQQVTSLTRPLSQEATAAMLRELIRGVVVGDNPRTTARLMLRRLEGAFNGGLTRALVIARTELLDAHRLAAMLSQTANADVLAGWQWVAQLDSRSCPSCWAQHGSIHPLTEPGPMDHQAGRCSRCPVTKSWRQLGFGVAEPPSTLPVAQARFRALPEVDQLRIMGPQRLELLRSGDVAWADLSTRRSTRGWRDSYAPTPVRDLTRKAPAAAA
jgi:hypothetical protein